MKEGHRSLCPINLALEVFGDRWTLLIIRDIMFAGRRHFRELLQSDEGISSNILADRLRMLVERGILTRADDPTHRQKAIYTLTERGIELCGRVVVFDLSPALAGAARRRVRREGLDRPAVFEDELCTSFLCPPPLCAYAPCMAVRGPRLFFRNQHRLVDCGGPMLLVSGVHAPLAVRRSRG